MYLATKPIITTNWSGFKILW